MLQIKFSSNPNGKLFNDRFGDVRLYDENKYRIGNSLEVILKGKEMGFVRIISLRDFQFRQLSDSFAYINCGRHAAYQAELLTRYYINEEKFTPTSKLMNVVFEYTQRDLQQHKFFLQEWWEQLVDRSQYSNTDKNLLNP